MLRLSKDVRSIIDRPEHSRVMLWIGDTQMTQMPKATIQGTPEPAISPSLPQEDRRHDEHNLDKAAEETFPASDPRKGLIWG